MLTTIECCALPRTAISRPWTSSRGAKKVRWSSGYPSRKRFSALYRARSSQTNGVSVIALPFALHCRSRAKGAIEQLLITEPAAQLALQAADRHQVLRRPRVLVRRAGQRRQHPGSQVSQLRDFRCTKIGRALDPDHTRPRRPQGAGKLQIPGVADRKSTRLNSSHANISYAVFCLKKKKNKYH